MKDKQMKRGPLNYPYLKWPDKSLRYGYEPLLLVDNKLALKAFIHKLSPEKQEIVELKYEGYTDQEIADKLGHTKTSVSHHWERGKEQLKAIRDEDMATYPDSVERPRPMSYELVHGRSGYKSVYAMYKDLSDEHR